MQHLGCGEDTNYWGVTRSTLILNHFCRISPRTEQGPLPGYLGACILTKLPVDLQNVTSPFTHSVHSSIALQYLVMLATQLWKLHLKALYNYTGEALEKNLGKANPHCTNSYAHGEAYTRCD
jgi:hypothetical protein